MNLTPARGYLYVVAQDTIPAASKEMGFSGKTEKFKLESPYKFKVLAVGAPRPGEGGVLIGSEVQPGDIISTANTNVTWRERIEQSGFLLEGQQVMVLDVMDVLGIWRPDAKTHGNDCGNTLTPNIE